MQTLPFFFTVLKQAVLDASIDEEVEEQERRSRGNCCIYLCGWIYGAKDMFNWFKVLWQLDDNRLQEINGSDYTLYLVYLRYASVLCAVITLFNCCVMVPLYASGEPLELDNWQT